MNSKRCNDHSAFPLSVSLNNLSGFPGIKHPLSHWIPYQREEVFFGNECSQTYQNNQQFALFAAEIYWIVVCPSNLQKAETWRLEAIPQFRKTCGYSSLRNAFPRDRICGNVAYTSVSRNGYLSFRRRKPELPLRNRCKWTRKLLISPCDIL